MHASLVNVFLRRTLCALLGILGAAGTARAEELFLLSAAAVEVPVREVVRTYEQSSGDRVTLEFSTAGGVENKLRSGARVDLVINTRERMEALASSGLVSAQGIRKLGTVRIGVAVRGGGRRPDIGSVDAFRDSLLKAESIAFGNPEKGATTGIHFDKVLQRLGIADAIRQKAVLADNGLQVMRTVAKGAAEIGVTQISEIMHIAPDTLVGPLPEQLQLVSVYSIGVGATAGKGAARLAEMLTGAEARERFHHAGFEQ
jgi:molybdate transport system substrate-binding protein